MKKKRFAVIVLLLLTLSQLVHCQLKYYPAAMMQMLSEDYGVSITEIGMVVSVCTVASGLSPVLASLLIDRKGSLFTNGCSALLVSLTGFLPLISHRFGFLVLAYVLCGAGIGFSFCLVPVMVAELITEKHRALILSISFALYSGYCAMAYSVPNLLLPLIPSWKLQLLLWSVMSLVIAVYFFVAGRKTESIVPKEGKTVRKENSMLQALRIPSVCVLTLVMTCFVWSNNTYATFLPTFLENVCRMDHFQSGMITGASFICGIAGCLAAGVLPGEKRNWFLSAFALLALLSGVGLGFGRNAFVLTVCSGLFGFAYQGWIPLAYGMFMSDKRMNARILGGAAALFDGVGHILTIFIPGVFALKIQWFGMQYTLLLTAVALLAGFGLQTFYLMSAE